MPGDGFPEDDFTAEALAEARHAATRAESKAASRSFPRLRLNVTNVSPGYVTCSLFQSDNAGTNWGCVGTGITFPEDWFRQTFTGVAEPGLRMEFELTGVHAVTG